MSDAFVFFETLVSGTSVSGTLVSGTSVRRWRRLTPGGPGRAGPFGLLVLLLVGHSLGLAGFAAAAETLAEAPFDHVSLETAGETEGDADGDESGDDDFDDLMGGFDDDFDVSDIEATEAEMPEWLGKMPLGEALYERVELGGSLSMGAVYGILDHSVAHGDQPGRRSPWGNLTRLDLDGQLQLDIDLDHGWTARAELLGWYDFAYRIRGRGQYGGEVLDVYEWQVDSGEVYVSGPLTDVVDLTVGRKIVNWGRSDTFRIVDVVNPLDNKEPGLVDIEDLRRPRTMIKLDAASGPWNGTLLIVPEHRYDRQPPPGSDFFPDLGPLRANPFFGLPPIEDRDDFSELPDFAARAGGSFSGWDFTVYGAYVDETNRVTDVSAAGLRTEANRYGLLGVAGNYTVSSWLFKIESAFLTGLHTLRQLPNPGFPPVRLESGDTDRFDTMVGVEYFGPDSLQIALEIVNRHLLRPAEDLLAIGAEPEQSRFESALRISRPFFRERLDVTLLAFGIGERLQGGGILRLSGDFELTDAWGLTGGGILYIGGPEEALGAFESNDRLFAEIKYSF